MLLKNAELQAIKARKVSVVFRRWKRSSVKEGGTLKTAVGVLAIGRVEAVDAGGISERDAAAAGFGSGAELLERLEGREGTVYRIEVSYGGADPRVALREREALDAREFEAVRKKLRRLDAASRVGAWTEKVLRAIEGNPMLAAGELAERTGFGKQWLKENVRKLKDLGLTISHHPGYELSPRGRAVLARLV